MILNEFVSNLSPSLKRELALRFDNFSTNPVESEPFPYFFKGGFLCQTPVG